MLIAFSGRLEEQDGSVLASSVTGTIEAIFTRWKGRMNVDASTARWLNNRNGTVRLVLSSGERGDLFVTSVHHGDELRVPVDFMGTGFLRQAKRPRHAGAFGAPATYDPTRTRSSVSSPGREQRQLIA